VKIGAYTVCHSGEELAKLLYAACVCSISVYDSSPEASIPGLKIDCVGYRSASLDGTRKCTALWTVDRASEGSEASKELIISIRGSASAVDHVVNLNGQERDMKSFFVSLETPALCRPIEYV
jgi:hypothetical protein